MQQCIHPCINIQVEYLFNKINDDSAKLDRGLDDGLHTRMLSYDKHVYMVYAIGEFLIYNELHVLSARVLVIQMTRTLT